jgi:hypothetical protein
MCGLIDNRNVRGLGAWGWLRILSVIFLFPREMFVTLALGFGLSFCAGVVVRKQPSNCNHANCHAQNALFDWIESNGGYVNPKIEISTGPDPDWTIRGIFATSQIEPFEQIFSFPSSLQLCDPDQCNLTLKLLDELWKGEESFYWPYLSMLRDEIVDLPTLWNDEERALLLGLQPYDWQRHLIWYEDVCEGSLDDGDHVRAMLLVVARSHGNDDQTCLTPLYDSANHPNNHEMLNTFILTEEMDFIQQATQTIPTGGQIFVSFGEADVGRLFRDYGFLPDYPRLWKIQNLQNENEEYYFECYDEDGLMRIDLNPFNSPHQESPLGLIQVLTQHLDEIDARIITEFDFNNPEVDPRRAELALEYRKEYIYAMNCALDVAMSLVTSREEM